MTPDLMSSLFPHWSILWEVIEISCCSAPSELFRSIWPGQSSFVPISLAFSSLCLSKRKQYPETPFFSGSGLSSTMPTLCLLQSSFGQGTQSRDDCCVIAVQEELCSPSGVEGWDFGLPSRLSHPSTLEVSPASFGCLQ